ncbi:MAG: transcription-repair coupling factor [Deltaproteobacteria bacterium]|nr:transcription-repair coupling factor [Deltaproteobacteria bacterium]
MALSRLRPSAGAPRPLVLAGLPAAGLPYLLACEGFETPLTIVTANEERAGQLVTDLRAFGVEDVRFFPGEPHVAFEDVSPDPRLVFDQLGIRHRILTGDRPRVLVVSAVALIDRWLPDADFLAATDLWVVGQCISRAKITEHLVRCGYQPVTLVEDEGTFAIRGGVVDLYPPSAERPVRLDLFGDEIASIKSFDPESQRNLGEHESLAVHPLRGVLFGDAQVARAATRLRALAETTNVPTRRLHATLADIEQRNYFFGIEALWPAFYDGSARVLDAVADPKAALVLDQPREVEAALDERWRRAAHERERALAGHRLTLGIEEHLVSPAEVLRDLQASAALVAVPVADDRVAPGLPVELGDWRELSRRIGERRADTTKGEILDPLVNELKSLFDKRQEVFLACGSRGNAERLRELLRARKLDLPFIDALPPATTFGEARRTPRIAITTAALSAGIRDPQHGVAILTDVEIFGAARQAEGRRRRRAPSEGLATLRDLSDGDLVIHVDHGVGRYLGLKRLILGGVDGDYVSLEYADGDRLYVPIYRLGQLQRYRGPVETVRLDKLGGTRWEKAKQRVKDAVLAMAHELLAVQARRHTLKGYAFNDPDDHFRAFEATFPYEETPDQQRAIDEVLHDLVQDAPMDRLVCGDVGFGKTEVAIRAAFLAVLAGKQVAVLVPTTVLAEQHGQTFRDRLRGEAVSVEVLSRFRSANDSREILRKAKAGEVDILIGTHRMLSADVSFRDLALLVVDEEHRFGVKQKERIKQWKSQVHVLSMSATPIPRTLHMSVTGLRDLSIITTPPPDRMSIRTEVTRFDEEVIQEAIRREIHRGGQVFVVHNRVQSISAMRDIVRRLVPEARVVVGHGQMTGEELERIMVEFVRREHNVLVSTAIIESGIDIPTANTMIINRADTFGLSQLYQLRGRIGRGRERGHAYLLLPRSDRVGKEALERLAVLKRFSELGSGFQVASFDLDLRGAGDLLGADQSGHIAAVGFELYTELLKEAVERARGQAAHSAIEPEIKLPVTAVLPESYVPEPMHRLAFYQRMAQSDSDAAVFDVLAEIEDLYGKAPDEVRHLAEVMVIRRRLINLGAVALSGAVDATTIKLGLTFVSEPRLDVAALALRVQREPERIRVLPSGRLALTLPAAKDLAEMDLLRSVREELGKLPLLAGGR